MALAIFDLDDTLLDGDSNELWGQCLADLGVIDAEHFATAAHRYMGDYRAGRLDIRDYNRFMLAPLVGRDADTLAGWRARFVETYAAPRILPAARELVARHQRAGDALLIITATIRPIAEPIAQWLGISEILACEAQSDECGYTGEPTGHPSFREGKLTRLTQWLEGREHELATATFYSDSHNDLPLLKAVGNPVAVNPDDALAAHARRAGWPILQLR